MADTAGCQIPAAAPCKHERDISKRGVLGFRLRNEVPGGEPSRAPRITLSGGTSRDEHKQEQQQWSFSAPPSPGEGGAFSLTPDSSCKRPDPPCGFSDGSIGCYSHDEKITKTPSQQN